MAQIPLEFNRIKPPFLYAMRQSNELKSVKNKVARHWQEQNIIRTLLAGLRGK